MRILYGVVGEGMGHATRSSVILKHLVHERGHEVEIVVSGKAHAYLCRRFPGVSEIEGLKMHFQGNRVDRSQTFWDLVKRLPTILSDNADRWTEISERFRPDLVISDFESFAYLFGKHREVPVISIDNMQVINRCTLDPSVMEGVEDDFRVAKGIVKAKLPGCHHYMITSFFFPPVRKERTSLYPPILRREILEAQASEGEHLLVYQTTTTNDQLLDILHKTKIPCRVYGLGREERVGNLEICGFSEKGFVNDLASCRGVLATGGFSLMGEAIYLGKPLLAVPLSKQYEQILNARYLEILGYGRACTTLTAEAVNDFNGGLPEYNKALAAGGQQQGNQKILGALDELISEISTRR